MQSESAKVTFEYLVDHHGAEIRRHLNAGTMFNLLFEIDQKCRSLLKYDESISGKLFNFAEEIREMIADEIDLEGMN